MLHFPSVFLLFPEEGKFFHLSDRFREIRGEATSIGEKWGSLVKSAHSSTFSVSHYIRNNVNNSRSFRYAYLGSVSSMTGSRIRGHDKVSSI